MSVWFLYNKVGYKVSSHGCDCWEVGEGYKNFFFSISEEETGKSKMEILAMFN